MEFSAPFGAWLKQRRVDLGMTRNDLARRIGYSPETLHKIEGGLMNASPSVAEHLIEPLEVPAHQRKAFMAFATGIEPHHKPHNLPAPATPLIGREHELAIARKWLRNGDVRLITFVGPPGVGKTRLALQVAWAVLDHYEDGAWLVALAATTDAAAVAAFIAVRLGLKLAAGEEAMEAVKQYLRDKHLLLLLDNFEQVLPASLHIAELLAAAPKLQVLATSRVALNLAGEHLFEVSPLDEAPAVELFVQRAQAINPAFKLNHNAGVVAEICSRLDRLPLAIELAAARSRLFDPPQLLARLDSRLALLTSSARDLPPQHRTLRDAIAASYALLENEEQLVLRRLSVFAGGFSLEAAGQVAGDNLKKPLIDALQTLIDHSLVKVDRQDSEARYSMLETIHEFAREELAASCEADAIERRHADYFAGWVGRESVRLFSDAARVMPDISNLRHAFDTAQRLHDRMLLMQLLSFLPRCGIEVYRIEPAGWIAEWLNAPEPEQPEMRRLYGPALLGVAQAWFDQTRDHERYRDMIERSAHFLDEAGDIDHLTEALSTLCGLAWQQGKFAQSVAYAERILSARKSTNDQHAVALAQVHLGAALRDCGRLEEAEAVFSECIALSHSLPDEFVEGIAENGMGDLEYDRSDLHASQVRYESALRLLRTGTVWERALPLRGLGRIACARGDLALADEQLGRVAAIAEQSNVPGQSSYVLHYYAWLKHLQGDDVVAASALKKAIHAQRKAAISLMLVESLERAAWIAADQHKFESAVQLFGACAALRQAMGTPQPAGDHAFHERAVALARAELDEPAFNAAWDAGKAMTLEEAAALALSEMAR